MFFTKPVNLDFSNFYVDPDKRFVSTTPGDVLTAYWNESDRTSLFTSARDNLDAVYTDHVKKVKEITGQDLDNPAYLVDFTGETKAKYAKDWSAYKADGGSATQSDFFDAYKETWFRDQLKALADKHPERAGEILPEKSFKTLASERAQQAERSAAHAWEQSAQGWKDWAGWAAGNAASGFTDPVNILTAPLGFGGVGTGLKGLAMGFAKTGGLNAGIEAAVQPSIQSDRSAAGLSSGWQEGLANVGAAFLFGGALDLGVRGTYRAGRYLAGHEPIVNKHGIVTGYRKAGTGPEAPVLPAETVAKADAGDPSAIRTVAEATGAAEEPEVRQVLDAVDANEAVIRAKPETVTDGEHARSLTQTMRAAVDPDAEPVPVVRPMRPILDDLEAQMRAELETARAAVNDNDAAAIARVQDLEARVAALDNPVAAAEIMRERGVIHSGASPEARMAGFLGELSDDAFALVKEGKARPEIAALVSEYVVDKGKHGALIREMTRLDPPDLETARRTLTALLRSPDHAPRKGESPAHPKRALDDPYGPDAARQVADLERRLAQEIKGEKAPKEQAPAWEQNVARETPAPVDPIAQAIDEAAGVNAPGTKIKTFRDVSELPEGVRGDALRAESMGNVIDALTTKEGDIWLSVAALDPAGRLRHETIHALRQRGLLTDAELKLLAERADQIPGLWDKEKYTEAYKDYANPAESLMQEAAAHLYEARSKGVDFGGQVNGILDRIKLFLDRLRNALRGMGYQTAEDVMRAIDRGEVAARDTPGRQHEQAAQRQVSPLRGEVTPESAAAREHAVSNFEERVAALRAKYGKTAPERQGETMFSISDKEGAIEERKPNRDLIKAVDEIKNGSRLAVVRNYVKGFVAEADEMWSLARHEAVVDPKGLSDEQVERISNAMDDLTEIVNERLQHGYDIAEQISEIDAKISDALGQASKKFGAAEWKLSDMREEMNAKMEAIEERFPTEYVDDGAETSTSVVSFDYDAYTRERQERLGLPYRSSDIAISEQASMLDALRAYGTDMAARLRDLRRLYDEAMAVDVDKITEAEARVLEERLSDIQEELTLPLLRAEMMQEHANNAASDVSRTLDEIHETTLGPALERLETAADHLDTIGRNFWLGLIREVAEQRRQALASVPGSHFPPDTLFAISDAQTGRSMRDDLDKLGFYSGALRAARNLRQAKGTPEQMLVMLGKDGAKKAEIEATGLDKFVDGKTSVTKDEIVGHLEQNRVGLNEVNYVTHGVARATRDATIDRIQELGAERDRINASAISRTLHARRLREIAEEQARLADSVSYGLEENVHSNVKWQSYSLDPSNPTYRETVLHLPLSESANKITRINDEIRRLPPDDPRFEALAHERQRLYDEGQRFSDQDFVSGHFPEPNITGHMMTSMVKHEGKPVFLIDQIQDDWAQRIRDDSRNALAQKLYGQRFDDLDAAGRKAVSKEMSAMAERGERPAGVRDEAKIARLTNQLASVENSYFSSPEGSEWLRSVNEIGRKAGIRKASTYREAYSVLTVAMNRGGALRDEASSIHDAMRKSPNVAELRRVYGEFAQAEQGAHGHPLVNTTDQWTTTTLRRAIRQAAEADADYIAIPHGDTVLSYNPGDEHGMRGFYGSRTSEGIVPKNLRKLLQKIDREAPAPQKVEKLETSQGLQGWQGDKGSYVAPNQWASVDVKNEIDPAQTGFTLFPITDKVKQSVMMDGQAMFAIAGRFGARNLQEARLAQEAQSAVNAVAAVTATPQPRSWRDWFRRRPATVDPAKPTRLDVVTGAMVTGPEERKIAMAETLAKAGMSDEEIFKATGAARIPGTESRFGFEIDDSGSKWKKGTFKKSAGKTESDLRTNELLGAERGYITAADRRKGAKIRYLYSAKKTGATDAFTGALGDVFDHESLYQAYPFLRIMPVMVVYGSDLPSAYNGTGVFRRRIDTATNTSYPSIVVRARNPNEARAALLHEIQHYIAWKERWPEGASPEALAPRLPEHKDNRWFVDGGIDKMFPLTRGEQALSRYWSELEDMQRRGFEQAYIDKREEELRAGLADAFRVGDRGYDASPGEYLARDTESRVGMTAAERAANRPLANPPPGMLAKEPVQMPPTKEGLRQALEMSQKDLNRTWSLLRKYSAPRPFGKNGIAYRGIGAEMNERLMYVKFTAGGSERTVRLEELDGGTLRMRWGDFDGISPDEVVQFAKDADKLARSQNKTIWLDTTEFDADHAAALRKLNPAYGIDDYRRHADVVREWVRREYGDDAELIVGNGHLEDWSVRHKDGSEQRVTNDPYDETDVDLQRILSDMGLKEPAPAPAGVDAELAMMARAGMMFAISRNVNAAFDPAHADSANLLYAIRDATGRLKAGSKERAQALRDDLDAIEKQFQSAGGDERAKLHAKRAALLNAAAEEKVLDDLAAYKDPSGNTDLAKALLRLVESYGSDALPGADLKHGREVIANTAFEKIEQFLWEFRKGAVTGDKRRNRAPMRAKMETVIREAAGKDTGDATAKAMANGLLETMEWLRQRRNAAGGDVGKLEGWFAPQHHDAEAWLAAGREKVVERLMQDGTLDRARMIDYETGQPMTDAKLRAMLRDTWQSVTTDGWSRREVGERAGKGAMYKRHMEHRVLHFKDADAWLAYNRELGGGDIYGAYVGHIEREAKEIAMMERLGANPAHVWDRIKQTIEKQAALTMPAKSMLDELGEHVEALRAEMKALPSEADAIVKQIHDIHTKLDQLRADAGKSKRAKQRARPEIDKLTAELFPLHDRLADVLNGKGEVSPRQTKIMAEMSDLLDEMASIEHFQVSSRDPLARTRRLLNRADEMFNLYAGNTNVPASSTMAQAMQGARNIISSSSLVFASISALTDQITQTAARSFVGMPVARQLTSFLSAFGKGDRREALSIGLGLDQVRAAYEERARYVGNMNARHITGYIADRTHAFSGLSAMTQASKVAFGRDFMTWMVGLVDTPLTKLEPAARAMLERHGFTAETWNALRAASPELVRGQRMLTRRAIAEAAGDDLAEAYMRMMLRERGMAVLEGTIQGRSAFISESKPGTVQGELLRSVSMLKSFPTTYMMLIVGRLMHELQAGEVRTGIKYAAQIVIGGTLLGALVMQMKALAQGRDPMPMDRADFWAKAFLQSGGGGIFGDFIANSVNRNGNGLAVTLAGPMADRASNLLDLTVGNVVQYAKDEKTNAGRELTKFLRQNTPGALVPFYLRLAYNRLLLDELQRTLDPEHYRAWSSQMSNQKKRDGNDFWYAPGSVPRAPNWAGALGARQ